MALLPGITQQHLPQLEVIEILPHNEKRILMLKDIKNGQNRSEILRMGITCHDMFFVIGGDDQVEHKDIIDGKFNASSNISLKQYGGCHERDSKEEFRAYMKRTSRSRIKMYHPGLVACVRAPFIYCAPHHIQNSPATALVFTYNVHELPKEIPRQVYIEVVCSLAISEQSWIFPNGKPSAIIYFCPPSGDGAVFTLDLELQQREDWARWSFAAVKFFLHSMLPVLLRGRDYAVVNYSSPSPSPVKFPSQAISSLAPDQTPVIKVGKIVEDPKHKGRRGVVKELRLDASKGELAIVEWEGKNAIRKKPYSVKNLEVVPHSNIQKVIMPTKRGDRVVVVGVTTLGLHGKAGVVEKYNAKLCSVRIDDEVRQISTSSLHCLDEVRPVTVAASTDCFIVPLGDLERMGDNINRVRSLKLIGGPSITKFVATAREKKRAMVAKTSNKLIIKGRRKKKKNKSSK